ncbi:nicotinate-nucleotide adenylyltransferase [Candidatus Pantoea carbekii]|uniref:Probable nicotinate-nucleotide adenylyltransferase n=1 Tax=Candidatus Pantoea carbekii TaxID=1235990 RepID=U3U3J6_9GAMM|nr:nicotinate-nucleotide adenylyltransferase [Candidatus Pantoea carbekii]AKC32208.1 nicotinate-nucleotide adenylyltransferase NadD [Candidatus Pantoea carbekii]BAO00741.1 hypothetical protein HHS_07710 [Candidatus Pantoea carbekii]
MTELYTVFGGTFDPIHYGHLRTLEALAKQVGLKKITLLPNNIPPNRAKPHATAHQRLNMLRFAIEHHPLFEIDTRQLRHEIPSWTVSTLEQLRIEQGVKQPIGFIIGQDCLLNLTTWYRWQDLLSLCHLLVCQRPGYAIPMHTPKMQKWLEKHLITDSNIQQLFSIPSGHIWLFKNFLINISSTEIRRLFYQGVSVSSYSNMLPYRVIDYIHSVNLYR